MSDTREIILRISTAADNAVAEYRERLIQRLEKEKWEDKLIVDGAKNIAAAAHNEAIQRDIQIIREG